MNITHLVLLENKVHVQETSITLLTIVYLLVHNYNYYTVHVMYFTDLFY